MKQMFIVGHGGPEKLQLRESPDPGPAKGEIRIRVKAIGVNFADILARHGLYPDSPKIPSVVGYEVSGIAEIPKQNGAFNSKFCFNRESY
jgi:synaptic vesicle membrane protein VAT-1